MGACFEMPTEWQLWYFAILQIIDGLLQIETGIGFSALGLLGKI